MTGEHPTEAGREQIGPETGREQIDVRRGMFGARDSGDTSGYGRLVRRITLPGSSPRPYGGYFDDGREREPSRWAQDEALARELWERSEAWAGIDLRASTSDPIPGLS